MSRGACLGVVFVMSETILIILLDTFEMLFIVVEIINLPKSMNVFWEELAVGLLSVSLVLVDSI